MTDFEMDKMYKITGREFLALLSLIPDETEKAKVIVENVAGREKSRKVNESQIDFLKPCPFCGSQAKIMHGPGDDWVECMGCHCMSEMHTMESRAVEDWNRRVSE